MLLFWGALCLWAGTAFAQDSSLERRMDQAWRDAMQGKGRAFEPDVKSRFAAKAVDTKPAFVKAFYFPRSFTAKDFLTGNYKGSKDFWMGDFKYDTKPANTSKPLR